MQLNRTLIVVQSPRAGSGTPDAACMYAGIDGHDVVLCTHDPRAAATPGAILIDAALLSGLDLFAPPDPSVHCRDYALYAARVALPDYAHYWLIDGQVRINTAEAWDFFGRFLDPAGLGGADLLAMKLGPRNAAWGAGERMAAGGGVHGCLFSVIRASGHAADVLLRARRRAGADASLASPQSWPHDQAFVPTAAVQAGLRLADLNGDPAAAPTYTEASAASTLVHDGAELASRPADGLIYHPVRDLEAWIEESDMLAGPVRLRTLDNPAGLRGPAGASLLDRMGHSCARSTHFRPSALVPLVLAESLWRSRPWQNAPDAPAIPAPSGRDAICRRTWERHFGGAKPVGTAHTALCRVSREDINLVKHTDFACGPGEPIARLPSGLSIPYAYDLEGRTLLLTLHAGLGGVLSHPFLYGGQREMTRVVARIGFSDLPAALGPMATDARPVLVFSVGRTGSTLFKQLIGCVTPRSISEPDAITQLGDQVAAVPEADRRALVYYAMAPLLDLRLPGGADGRCVIKLRSQVNGLAAEVAQAFPAAKYVFMLRERHAWARSTFRAFGMKPAYAANRLAQALRALRLLQTSGVDLSLIPYEGLVADPHATIGRLMGADPASDPALYERISAAATADSQAGHGLSRERTSRQPAGEAAWMAAFDVAWQACRPEKLVRALGVDY